MGKHDPRVDAYIAKSADFARPILEYLRAVIHEGCPEVEEAIKWGMPSFLYHGRILCGIAAFKQHCAFGFWGGRGLVGNEDKRDDAMGQFGRIASLNDLPSKKTLVGYVKQAMKLQFDRAHSLRQAIHACRKGGTISIPGVYAGFIDKIPFGTAFAKGLTMKMGQTHVHNYMRPLLDRIQKGEIDPSFIITHRVGLDDAPEMYKTFRDKGDDCIKVVMRP